MHGNSFRNTLPIFVPLALIRPRVAAHWLYGWDLEGYSDFWQATYRPLVAILPFYAKKYFMAKHGIDNYSPKMQVKFLMYRHREPEQITELVKKMTREGVVLFWKQNEENWLNRQCCIKADVILTDDQFKLLTLKGETNLAQEYVERHTPSEAMLKMLVNAQLGNVFYYCVARYGLSAAMVNYVYSVAEQMTQDKSRNEFRKGLVTITQEALQHYADRQMVRNSQSVGCAELWKAYLKEGNRPCIAAQKMMRLWQYTEFHQEGLALAPSVVEYFLACADQNMCVKIFEYEDEEKFTEKARALIKANPTLMQWLLASKKQLS